MDQLKLHASAINTVTTFSSTKVPSTSNKPGNYQTFKKVNQSIFSTPTLAQLIMKPGIFLKLPRSMLFLLIAHTCQDGQMLEVFFGSDQSILLQRLKLQKLQRSTRRKWAGTSLKISAKITTIKSSAQNQLLRIKLQLAYHQECSYKSEIVRALFLYQFILSKMFQNSEIHY